MSTKKKIKCMMLGGGGHTKVLIDCLDQVDLLILDANKDLAGKKLHGIPIVGDESLIPAYMQQGYTCFIVGVGTPQGRTQLRQRIFEKACDHGLKPYIVVHRSAIVSSHAVLGRGAQCLPGSVVNAGAQVGCNVIVNTGAIVEHDCNIGNHAHIATGARLAGGVYVEEGSHIGAGATVREGITVGAGAIVGAGAVVVKNVAPSTVVAGVPAQFLRMTNNS